jgi:hypothetical protein
VLMLRRTTDPEMGQELYMLGCMLHTRADGMITEQGRLSWMDGSDGDDEDQHRWNPVRKEAESQSRSVPLLFII